MNIEPRMDYTNVMSNKAILIKKQRQHIELVLSNYRLTLTELAKGVDIASTTLTRWYNGNPKHALSATTFDKIANKYPTEEINNKNKIGETDLAVTFAIKTIIGIMLKYKMAKPKEFEEPFTQAIELYHAHRLPEAEKIMEDFRMFAGGGTHPKGTEMLRKLLELVPVGQA